VRVILAGVVLVAGGLGVVSPAHADVGVSITPGAVRLTETVKAGSTVTLPTLEVKNVGDAPATLTMAAMSLRDSQRRSVDASWVTFDTASLPLAAQGSRKVAATVKIPRSAPAGTYEVLLQATVQVAAGPSGTAAPAAASRVVFEVTAIRAWWRNPIVLVAGGAAVALLAVGLRALVRRSGISITINRRRPPAPSV